MLYWVPVFFFIGSYQFTLDAPLVLPEPVVACVANIYKPRNAPKSKKVTAYECYRKNGSVLRFKVTGEFEV